MRSEWIRKSFIQDLMQDVTFLLFYILLYPVVVCGWMYILN